jgi:hypothetical protein
MLVGETKVSRTRLVMLSLLAVFAISAVVSASASAGKFEVCAEGGGSGTKYTTHKCEIESGTGKWEWVVFKTGLENKVESSGGTFTLKAALKTVTCEAVADEGTIGEGGKDEATKIAFTKCKTGTAGCEVKNKGGVLGTVEVTAIPTLLEEVGGKLVNKYSQKTVGTTKEFVTLEFSGTSCAGAGYVTTKIKGDVAAEVKNEPNGEVKLTFPEPAIAQTPELEAFSASATLVGTVNEKLKNAWAFRATK